VDETSGIDWPLAGVVALIVLVALVATFRFGDRGDQFGAVMAGAVFLFGTAVVYRRIK
jgi:uncharacterized membrane protein